MATGNYSDYSVNPLSTDILSISHRGQTATISGLIGDTTSLNRCIAIANIVQQINSNATLQSMNIQAQLPSQWEGIACDDNITGQGQFFYLTHNPTFSLNDGVNISTAEMTTGSIGAVASAALREDIRIEVRDSDRTVAGVMMMPSNHHIVRFFEAGRTRSQRRSRRGHAPAARQAHTLLLKSPIHHRPHG